MLFFETKIGLEKCVFVFFVFFKFMVFPRLEVEFLASANRRWASECTSSTSNVLGLHLVLTVVNLHLGISDIVCYNAKLTLD